MFADFHFLRPLWFLALLPLLALVWFMFKRGLDNQQWRQVCDPELLPYILVGQARKRGYRRETLIGLTGLALIIALAGPTWERLPQPVYKNESALVIAMDLSLSMYADDVQPTRLERARFEISDLLDMRKEGQTALLVYAGDAFTVTPLTDDINTIKSQLSALSPDIMPAPGSDTTQALALAASLLQQAGHRDGDVLVVTDEIEQRHASALSDLQQEGYRVSILGIGSKEGAPIKLDGGGYLKAPDGSIVIPTLDAASLQELAALADGIYQTSRIDDADTRRFHDLFVSQLQSNDEAVSDLRSDSWYEVGPWLILPLLPLLALGFRKGIVCSLALVLVVQQDNAMAFDWAQLWRNDNQRGQAALEQQQPEQAAALFRDPKWKAAAHYRSGNYAEAEKLLAESEDITDVYNRANALAKQGRLQEAIELYEDVLQRQPQHEDARYNHDLLAELLQNQEQQQQSSEQGDEQQQSQQQQEQQGQQQQSEQAQSEQQQDEDSQNDSSAAKQAEEQQQQLQPQSEQEEAGTEDEEDAEQASTELAQQLDEQEQASEQWLRRIPDDPAGLLRRKFKYQYQQSERQNNTGKYW